jgi:hypothetical protein
LHICSYLRICNVHTALLSLQFVTYRLAYNIHILKPEQGYEFLRMYLSDIEENLYLDLWNVNKVKFKFKLIKNMQTWTNKCYSCFSSY